MLFRIIQPDGKKSVTKIYGFKKEILLCVGKGSTFPMDLIQGIYLRIFRNHIWKTLRQLQKKISYVAPLFRGTNSHMLTINAYL